MRVRPFLVALLLPLAVTAATLAAVAWNRSAGRGPIVLSEREVRWTGGYANDNTTATLWLVWQPEGRGRPSSAPAELRRGYAALELRDEAERSRLFVVDVAADGPALQRKYPDGRTHIITAATIAVPAGGTDDEGYVISVDPQRLHVPRELREPLTTGRFDVELWYGVRYEPWISAIRRRPR
jgi:hypothetical protein